MVETIGSKTNNYTMWVDQSDKKKPVPVRYEMLGYDLLLGSHYDKYYLEYENYKTGADVAFPKGTFEVPDGKDDSPLLETRLLFIY